MIRIAMVCILIVSACMTHSARAQMPFSEIAESINTFCKDNEKSEIRELTISESEITAQVHLDTSWQKGAVETESGYVFYGGYGQKSWFITYDCTNRKFKEYHVFSVKSKSSLLSGMICESNEYMLCYEDTDKKRIDIVKYDILTNESRIVQSISGIVWAEILETNHGFGISGYEETENGKFDMYDAWVNIDGSIEWEERLPLGLEMPWAVHAIDEAEDGLLFSADRYIWKRENEGRLLWISEPEYDYNYQTSFCMSAADDTCMVIGQYFHNAEGVSVDIPIVFVLDEKSGAVKETKLLTEEYFGVSNIDSIRMYPVYTSNEALIIFGVQYECENRMRTNEVYICEKFPEIKSKIKINLPLNGEVCGIKISENDMELAVERIDDVTCIFKMRTSDL